MRYSTLFHVKLHPALSSSPLASLDRSIYRLDFLSNSCKRRRFGGSTSSSVPTFAFAFDIDGVLVRSSAPIPSAKNTLSELQARTIPFILLTNGGGKHEQERVSELSTRLGVPLSTEMFIQSHTPFAGFPSKDEPVLVAGGEGDKCRQVAESYGFTKVVTPSDIYHANPAVWPFSTPFASYHATAARPLPLPIYDPSASSEPPTAGKHLRIASMFVYNDPRDFALDLQLILDLLLSHQGFMGTRSKFNGRQDLRNSGFQQDGQPPLTIANPDLFWAAKWHLPRLGSGAFKAALEGLWQAATGGKAKLELTVGGKPSAATFGFAEDRLESHRQALLGRNLERGNAIGDLKSVYMVGDNPASDIKGANTFESPRNTAWSSILVRSGVFAGEMPPDPTYQPKIIVDDVLDAVNWGLEQEGQEPIAR